MAIEFTCVACGKQLKAPDERAGKTARCPHCQRVVEVPEPVYDAEESPPVPVGQEIHGDRGMLPRSAKQEERRPCPMCGELILSTAVKCRFCGEIFDRELKRDKNRRGRVGDYEPCPKCSSTDARKVSFTWWGGVLGPWLFNHVKCCDCGATYNGKTGKSNNGAIAVYTLVGIVIGILLLVAFIWSQ
jgi:hypothetical protein